jgi:DNA polymerase
MDSSVDSDSMDWPALRKAVAGCTRCPLHQSRTQTVFGVGDPEASWMIVGEAPGAEEDRRGEPFVGRAGKLLDEMLRAVGQERESVFIANILKCRPPNNRDPSAEESSSCRAYLERQIELVQPKIILAVGRVAAQLLLATDAPVGRLRGSRHVLGNTPLVVTYHPAYLLRSPSQKRKAWDDLCLARRIAAEASG